MRKLYQKRYLSSLKKYINKLNIIIRKKFKSKVNERWEKTLVDLRPGDKTMWRISKASKKATYPIPTLTKEDKNYMTNRDKVGIISKTLVEVQTKEQTTPLEDEIETTVLKYLQKPEHVQVVKVKPTPPQEMKNIIKYLPNKKAQGNDDIDKKII